MEAREVTDGKVPDFRQQLAKRGEFDQFPRSRVLARVDDENVERLNEAN
jgi:hypothetical protein